MFISSYPYTFLKSPVSGHLVKSPSPTTALQLNVSCTFTRLSIVLSFSVFFAHLPDMLCFNESIVALNLTGLFELIARSTIFFILLSKFIFVCCQRTKKDTVRKIKRFYLSGQLRKQNGFIFPSRVYEQALP